MPVYNCPICKKVLRPDDAHDCPLRCMGVNRTRYTVGGNVVWQEERCKAKREPDSAFCILHSPNEGGV
jgi:hypothetical protein